MIDESRTSGDRRRRGDRRSGADRRSGQDRRGGGDRRSGRDRRAGWDQSQDQRFQGVLSTTATVSHLFSQPLTVVLGYVDLLSSSTEDETTKNKLIIIKEQLELIAQYLQNLRSLERYKTIDFGSLTLLDIESEETAKDK
ncbi:MAG: hypothetical protein JSU72_03960 [Deltaproteobacteria bacterium]|nr:MAG: hypothetical protein JSU72_03960 [Deltaproteobacteria bacterium]